MKQLIIKNLSQFLNSGREVELANMLNELHPADIAEILNELDLDETISVIELLDNELAADVLVELNDTSRDRVATKLSIEDLTRLVAEMDSDDAADIVSELSDDEADKVLAAIEPEDSEEVRRLLMYEGDTAGGLMQVELISALEEETVEEVIAKIRLTQEEIGDLVYVFIVDERRILRGQVGLKDLLLATPETKMHDLVSTPPIVLNVDENQELVAKKFQKYDVKAAPVVDSQGRLIGRVTVDDIFDVFHEETDKDFYRLAGSSEEEIYSSGPLKTASLRIPWLLFNLGGGFITSFILKYSEAKLVDILSLFVFVPMVMSLSGAVGSQSATITVRGLAVGRITEGQGFKTLFHEFKVSSCMALFFGVFIAIASGSLYSAVRLGLAVGTSIVGAIIVSTLLGSVTPLFFKAIKIDPALASGPVVTSINDVVSLLIYLTVGSFILSI